MVSIDAYGMVTFYGAGDSRFKNKVIMEKQYFTESLTNELEAFPITAIAFN